MNLFDGRFDDLVALQRERKALDDQPQAPQAKGLTLDDCVTRNTVQGTQEALRAVSLAHARLLDARRAYERAGVEVDEASVAYQQAVLRCPWRA